MTFYPPFTPISLISRATAAAALRLPSLSIFRTSELAEVPALVSEAEAEAATVTVSADVAQENVQETAEANEENALVAAGEGGEGKLGDEGLVEPEIAVEYASDEAMGGGDTTGTTTTGTTTTTTSAV